jgi:hypothetical protein
MKFLRRCALLALLVLPTLARAADIDGAALALWWGVPFAGLLLSIALMPLLVPIFWHHHFGKVTAAWGLAFLVPFALAFGGGAAGVSLVHALLAEYLPFVILLTALFTVAGGIYIRGNLHGNPLLNTAILAIGAVLASFMGTTGASMLLIRPLIRANDNRAHKAHVVVFFIFIVSNAGGSLTPLGDPPLFLGFLKGVDFFWTVSHIFPETLFLIGVLLALFFAIDSWFFHKIGETMAADPTPDTRGIGFDGKVNFALLGAVVALVLLSGFWKSPVVSSKVGMPGIVATRLAGGNGLSLWPCARAAPTNSSIRPHLPHHHSVIAMSGRSDGPFGAIEAVTVQRDAAARHDWAAGALSFSTTPRPVVLQHRWWRSGHATTTLAPTLAAISAGAVL